MKENRSAFSPLDWEQGKNDGQFVRVRIASSADIIPQKWQTKTEIPPPLLFRSNERWLCDWSDGDFEEGKFSIDDNGGGENYTLTLKFRSRVAPIDFQAWYNHTLKKQQVCLELTDANTNERIFNPFDVSYKINQQQVNGDMAEYELTFVRSKLIDNSDRIISVVTDCSTSITKFVMASGKPENYKIIAVQGNKVLGDVYDGETGIVNLEDGKYIGYAIPKNFEYEFLFAPSRGLPYLVIDPRGDFTVFASITFEVKCNSCLLEIKEIEEIFDCTMQILSIEEITTLAENEGILVTGINS
jgi:hypothetical protein